VGLGGGSAKYYYGTNKIKDTISIAEIDSRMERTYS
jgi:hypothetical protein